MVTTPREELTIEKYRSLSLIVGLIALAVVLKFFEIPYPPAPFLKYDVSGVPLAVVAYYSLKYSATSLLVYYVIPVLFGFDAVGMAMKCLAEASTFTPLVLVYKRLSKLGETTRAGLAVAVSALVRVTIMILANYAVTPHWLVWSYKMSYEDAYELTLLYMPHIVVFNLTIALIIAPLTLISVSILKRSGYLS
jgi:riboflavin transporter FmnP